MKNIGQHKDEHADGIVEDRNQAPPVYFNLLLYGLIIWGVIFIAYFLLSGWSSHQEFDQKMATHNSAYSATPPSAGGAAPLTAAPAKATGKVNAEELFASNCAICHGEDGKGGAGPDLSMDYEYGKTPAEVKTTISEGHRGEMPAFGGRLSSEEIDALVDYVLRF
jgi:cytochrome c oxidase cbb3-type subunit 3